jgi:hypothetical protein
MYIENRHVIAYLGLFGAALLSMAASPAVDAQEAPRAWVASPDVYKVIGENEKFRAISAIWQPGQHDKPHSHKPLGTYFLTNCHVRLYEGGKTREAKPVAGRMFMQKAVKEHSLENIGDTECRMVIFEEK